jgi:hypothetical protein
LRRRLGSAEQIVGVVTAIGDDMAAFEAIQQLGSSRRS